MSKQFWSASEVAELTAAAVAALPPSMTSSFTSPDVLSTSVEFSSSPNTSLHSKTRQPTTQNSTMNHAHLQNLTIHPTIQLTGGSIHTGNGHVNMTNDGNITNFQGDLAQIDAGLSSDDADLQLEAARKLRVLLSSERDLLIRQVLFY